MFYGEVIVKKNIQIKSIFGKLSKIEILIYLSRNAATATEIELALDIYASALQNLLGSLVREGVLTSWKIGQERYFAFNKEHVLYKQLVNLVREVSKYYKIRDPKSKHKRFHRAIKKAARK